ncbi:hypothetical protein BUALT_Bualt16G0040200 [Buddleja alternifolia]|uniref:TF-B3 domain-containing protein n=1 Tax=Buddleja alternifolia TaxID=168488 RepID=A0AAV6WI69_9LAMI|nr:hypothetical protein BUALT_Bualt16G0040200 [Buddleja alternifolia]
MGSKRGGSLIAGLNEIVVQGWKADNGFKVGYLRLLEQHMISAFPGTDLRAMPHLNSRIHVWQKNYASLSSMLLSSGIRFNHTTNMIDTHDEAWENYVKTDSNARLMMYKCWPLFKDWIEVFGKDRATGEHAADFVEAVNHTLNKTQSQSSVSATTKKVGPQKRKFEGYELLGNYCKNTDSRLGEIVTRIGVEYDVANTKKEVYAVVNKVEGLTLHQKLFVADKLGKKTKVVYMLFSLPEVEQAEYIRMKLSSTMLIYINYFDQERYLIFPSKFVARANLRVGDTLNVLSGWGVWKFVVQGRDGYLIPSTNVWNQFVEAHDVKLGDTLVFRHYDDMYFFVVHYDQNAEWNGQLVDGLWGVTDDENDDEASDDVEIRSFMVTIPLSSGYNYHANRLARLCIPHDACVKYELLAKHKVILKVPSAGDFLIFTHQVGLEFFVIVYDDEVHKNGIIDLELDYVMDDYISDDPDESDNSNDDIKLLNMFSVTIPHSSAYNYNPAHLAGLCILRMAWKKYGLLTKKKAELRVPRTGEGPWEVELKWIPRPRNEEEGSFAMKRRWSKFGLEHTIKMGDSCLFAIVDEEEESVRMDVTMNHV